MTDITQLATNAAIPNCSILFQNCARSNCEFMKIAGMWKITNTTASTGTLFVVAATFLTTSVCYTWLSDWAAVVWAHNDKTNKPVLAEGWCNLCFSTKQHVTLEPCTPHT